MNIQYSHDRRITPTEFIDVLNRSTLGRRRPVAEPDRIAAMLQHANLLCTAWNGANLIGVARSITDFSYCCYLSDLAVDLAYQRHGIGTALIRLTQTRLHPDAKVILLSAPAAQGYYPKIGLEQHPSAWTIAAATPLTVKGGK